MCDAHFATSVELGLHAIACFKYGELRTGRHNAIRDRLVVALQNMKSGAHVDVEAALGPNSRKRSDVRWLFGADVLHLDVSVVSPSTPHALAKDSHLHAKIAATLHEDQKRREYDANLRAAGLTLASLRPLVFETSARPGKEVENFKQWMDKKSRNGEVEHARTFLQRAVQEIWLFNARILSAVVRNSVVGVRN